MPRSKRIAILSCDNENAVKADIPSKRRRKAAPRSNKECSEPSPESPAKRVTRKRAMEGRPNKEMIRNSEHDQQITRVVKSESQIESSCSKRMKPMVKPSPIMQNTESVDESMGTEEGLESHCKETADNENVFISIEDEKQQTTSSSPHPVSSSNLFDLACHVPWSNIDQLEVFYKSRSHLSVRNFLGTMKQECIDFVKNQHNHFIESMRQKKSQTVSTTIV